MKSSDDCEHTPPSPPPDSVADAVPLLVSARSSNDLHLYGTLLSPSVGLSVKSIQLRVRAQHVVFLIDCFWGDQEAPSLIGIQLVEVVFRGNDQIFLQNLFGVAANVDSCLDASAKQPFAQSLDCYGHILGLDRSDLEDSKGSDFFNSSLWWQNILAKVGFSSIYDQFSACRCNVLLALNMYMCISYQRLCLRKD